MNINWEVFTPIEAALGGALIGISASILLLFQGKVAGISGVFGGLFRWPISELQYRFSFLIGLLIGGILIGLLMSDPYNLTGAPDKPSSIVAGLLVGFGTQLGSGCTSGHGVCGLSRLSTRSFVSVCVFMAIGFLTASSIAYFGGGGAS